jgi:O-antigen/teichoic acid export membrane protein
VITARLLGRAQFGAYGMIQSTVSMFGVFAGVGLGLTATKYVAELRATNPNRAGRIIALSTAAALGFSAFAALALLAVAPRLAASTLNAPQLSEELRIASGVLFLNAVSGTQAGVLAGFEAFRSIARVNLGQGILTVPFAVGGALLWGLRGAVVGLVAVAVVGWVLNDIAIRAECRRNRVPVRWDRCWSDGAILLKFSLPAFLGGALTSPAMWAASSILVNQPHGYAQMGVFSAANQWRTAVAFLPALLSRPLLSILSNLGVGEAAAFRRLLRVSIMISFALGVFTAAPLIIGSSWIMKAYGRDFEAGRSTLVVLALATVISSTVAVIGQAIASLDRMWWGFNFNLIWALVLLSSASLLAPRYGALGLAGAFLLACSVHALAVTAYMRFRVPSLDRLQCFGP